MRTRVCHKSFPRRALAAAAFALVLAALAFRGRLAGSNARVRPFGRRAPGVTYAHVVYTRFCLGQGNASALVAARLALLEHICLPTVASQSTTRFAWLVLVDETLPRPARAKLEALLAAAGGGGRFRVVEVAADSQRDLWMPAIRRGLPGLRADYLIATRLDADDGLPLDYLARLPRAVAGAARRRRVVVACFTTALEWRASTRMAAGALERAAEDACQTPGLSWAAPFRGSLGTALEHLRTVPTLDAGRVGTESRHWFVLQSWTGPGRDRTCVQANGTGALPIQSRTAASNGMRHVDSANFVEGHDAAAWRDARGFSRGRFEAGWGLSLRHLATANAAVAYNEAAIAAEQLSVRCRAGWSCKSAARAKLEALAAGRAPRGGGHETPDVDQPCELYVLTLARRAGRAEANATVAEDPDAAAPEAPAPPAREELHRDAPYGAWAAAVEARRAVLRDAEAAGRDAEMGG